MSVEARWGVRIPLRDGVHLAAILYRTRDCKSPQPVIVAMTPYIAQIHHEKARYLAERGYIFAAVDVRGRGNSTGDFIPFEAEGRDGYDVIEWLAAQPFCDGNVAMCGASYEAYIQWRTVAERPPHLRTIVPVAAPYPGNDFPIRKNIASPYVVQWLTVVAGRTAQEKIFSDRAFYAEQLSRWAALARPFRQLDNFLGYESAVFQEWLDHSSQSDYWDRLNPTPGQYANVTVPILTITGCYDGDQPGALKHHHEHLARTPEYARLQHYLVMGPWDHAGTVRPQAEVGGLKLGDASVIDLNALRCQWYDWTLRGGPKPAFLQGRVTYYVMGAELWRYADSLDELTTRHEPLFLHSMHNPTEVTAAGRLRSGSPANSEPAQYVYNPLDVRHSRLEALTDPDSVIDQRMIYAAGGQQLIYHSVPCEEPFEIVGFFKLTLWLAIDQPDADFRARVYEITPDGPSILLSSDWIRARFRENPRSERLIDTPQPLKYELREFPFIARRIAPGSRLRLVIDSFNSIYTQKNFNGGGRVVDESGADARTVTVRLFADPQYPSVLHVPHGREHEKTRRAWRIA